MENKKVPPARCVHVGGLCAPDSRALTSDLGSSRLSPGAARPLFTQDATRGPRSCLAGALPNPPFRDSQPLPLRRQPGGRILRRGTPAPPPPGPSARRLRPDRAGCLALRGPGGGESPGRREEARPAAQPRPGPVDCHWSARPAPSPWPRRPIPSAESGGGNGVAPLPASLQLFFFSFLLGGTRG